MATFAPIKVGFEAVAINANSFFFRIIFFIHYIMYILH